MCEVDILQGGLGKMVVLKGSFSNQPLHRVQWQLYEVGWLISHLKVPQGMFPSPLRSCPIREGGGGRAGGWHGQARVDQTLTIGFVSFVERLVIDRLDSEKCIVLVFPPESSIH